MLNAARKWIDLSSLSQQSSVLGGSSREVRWSEPDLAGRERVSDCMGAFRYQVLLIRHYAYTRKWAKYRIYHPNMMCVGLAFVLPQTYYGTAMVIGAVPAYFWAKRNPKHFDIYGYAFAAGLIAGEGIGGVMKAIFEIAGISGPTPYGTQIACPANSC